MTKPNRAQCYDTFPLGDPDACTCARCRSTRPRPAAQDALSQATPAERYIAHAIAMDGGSSARAAYMADTAAAHKRLNDQPATKPSEPKTLDREDVRAAYMARTANAYRVG